MILRDKGKLQTVVAEIEDTQPQIPSLSLSLFLSRCAGCGSNSIRVSSVSQVVWLHGGWRGMRRFSAKKKKKKKKRKKQKKR